MIASRADSGVPWQVRLVPLAAIWGMSFLFIKVGDEEFAPLQVAFIRMLVGTATLLLILALRREGLPRDPRIWMHLTVAAIFFNALPFSLFAYGELHTTSVLAGIWNATTPLFTAPLALLILPGERLDRGRLVGLILGFLGVLIVLGIWRGLGENALAGNLLCMGAAISYGFGFPYTRKYLSGRPHSVLSLAAGQLVCGTVELAIITPFVTRLPAAVTLPAIGSVFVLGALGTGIAYILNYGLIRDAGPTAASTVTYLVPLFSTVVGVLVLGEPLTWYEPAGALVVILGVAVSQGRIHLQPRRRAAHAEVAKCSTST